MSEPKTISDEKATETQSAQTPTAESAVAAGRTRYESAMQMQEAAAKCAELLSAVRQFQAAIQTSPDTLEAYGWLAHTYRILAGATRPTDPERAEMLTRYACAVACEGSRHASSAAAIPIRTKQEVRTLIAWLRTTRHVSQADAETEMETIRAQALAPALDADTLSSRE
jgi:hypothetical protein